MIIFLCFIPLTTFLGRQGEYEYSLFLGWGLLLLAPFFDSKDFKKHFMTLVGTQALLCWSFCSPGGSLFWFLFHVLPSFFLGQTLVKFYENKNFSRLQKWAAHLSFVFLSLLWTLGYLWVFPQKRILSFFWGWIHGPIYDDWIPISLGVLGLRLFHICTMGWIYTLVEPFSFFKKGKFIFFSFFAVLGLVGAFYDPGSWRHGFSPLNTLLPHSLSQEGWTLHYDPLYTKEATRLAKEIAFHRAHLIKILKIHEPPHIQIYFYPSPESKKVYFGGYYTDIAETRTPSVHISVSPHWFHPTLRHELVHALTSSWTFLGFHPSMGITEGLATALAPEGQDLHEEAKILWDNGYDLDHFFSLSGSWFWFLPQEHSYAIAGSFFLFLSQKNPSLIKDLYSGQISLEKKILEEWQDFLQSLPKPPAARIESLKRASHPWQETCPHTKAQKAPNLWDPLSSLRGYKFKKILKNQTQITGDPAANPQFLKNLIQDSSLSWPATIQAYSQLWILEDEDSQKLQLWLKNPPPLEILGKRTLEKWILLQSRKSCQDAQEFEPETFWPQEMQEAGYVLKAMVLLEKNCPMNTSDIWAKAKNLAPSWRAPLWELRLWQAKEEEPS